MMVPAKMEVQESNGSTLFSSFSMPLSQIHVDVQTSPLSNLQLKEMGVPGDEQFLKVRKPYTITKQREKWTEEEHNKFLEALQLHGRAWRRIEEHIGTKTAVQIRSHAQKFFSKVVRESASSDGSNSLKSIDIPPPRPKRKPLHPYPRKLGNFSSKSITILKQPERHSLQFFSGCELENRSPTSVLSTVGSETLGSIMLNPQNGYTTAPVASADGSTDFENGGQSPTSTIEENKLPPPGLALCSLAMRHDHMEQDRLPGENVTSQEASSVEAQAKTIRLFGKTVALTDSQKQSLSNNSSIKQNLMPTAINITQTHHVSKASGQHNLVAETIKSYDHNEFTHDPSRTVFPSYAGDNISPFYAFPFTGDNSTNPTIAHLPWSVFWRNLPKQVTDAESIIFRRFPPPSTVDSFCGQETHREGSVASSDDESVNGEQNCEILDSTNRNESETPSRLKPGDASAFGSWRLGIDEPARGFVPYKRCMVESEEKPAKPRDDGESQAVRLCL